MADEADDRVDELRAMLEAAPGGDTIELPRAVAFELLERAGPKPNVDPDYDDREGYDEDFLGPRLSLPKLPRELEDDLVTWERGGRTQTILPYHHFSLALSASRRFARFTAVNIDGGHEFDYDRTAPDRWVYDRRIPREAQAGDEVYGRPFDRGHLVRRLDPVWGRTIEEAVRANFDTFHWTNCTPQHSTFNERPPWWAGLERYILNEANAHDQRLTVFTGPVLAADDPPLRGIQVPLQFWKVAAWAPTPETLRAAAYRLSQRKFVKTQRERLVAPEEPFELGRFKTFQVTVEQVEELTGLDFGVLRTVDAKADQRLRLTGGEEAAAPRELRSFDDVVL
jgi:endonuclease G